MPLELVDTHAHLGAPDFEADLDEVIERAKQNGVGTIISIGAGYGMESAARAVQLARKYPALWASVGVHPHDAGVGLENLQSLEKLAAEKEVVAIGETGLDFYRDWSPKDLQEKWFIEQIKLALSVSKPLIIHSRNAGEECFRILKENGAEGVGGVFHCFAEDSDFAARLREINFLVSFPGTVTFKKAEPLREIVKSIPLDQIMLETDAPYMAPEPYRGKRCESGFMIETARMMAQIKGLALEELAEVTTATARRLFKLPVGGKDRVKE